MGYALDEVLGRRSVDFLTAESRARATSQTLPLFWDSGRAHSVGYGFVRKNGRIINIFPDAVTIERPEGARVTLATLCNPDDDSQWQQATTTLRTLQQLDDTLGVLANIQYDQGPKEPVQPEPEEQALAELSKSTQEVTEGLQALSEFEERKIHEIVNQQQVLKLLAETIETWLPLLSGTSETPQTPT